MLMLLAQVGEEQINLLPKLVSLFLVFQHGTDAEDELGDSGVGSIPGTVLSLALGWAFRIGQVGGKLASDVVPAALCLSQPICTYEFTFDDSPRLALGLTQVYCAVLALAREEMEIRVVGTQHLVRECLKRIPNVFLGEPWVEILPKKPRDFHGLHLKMRG